MRRILSDEIVRRAMLWLVMAATAVALLMVSQLAHASTDSDDAHTHVPLAAVLGVGAAESGAAESGAAESGAAESGAAESGAASERHDNHDMSWNGIHALMVVLTLELAILLRRGVWTSTIPRPNPSLIAPRDRAAADLPPPAPVSVLDAGCLLRV